MYSLTTPDGTEEAVQAFASHAVRFQVERLVMKRTGPIIGLLSQDSS